MRAIGDKVKLPDGRHGIVVGVTVPIAAWKGANGRLMMERKGRELEVEVVNKDGSSSRVFVREEDKRGILFPSALCIVIFAILAFVCVLFWK